MKDGKILYTTEQLIKDIDAVNEITNRLRNIVWCEQTPDFNFDKLCKTEQIQLIGLFNNASFLYNSLQNYKSWFRNE